MGFGLGKFLIEHFDLLTILLIEPAGRGALFLQRPFFLTQLGLQQGDLGLKFRAHLLAFLRDGRFVLVRRRLQVLKTLLEHIPLGFCLDQLIVAILQNLIFLLGFEYQRFDLAA